MDLYKEKIPNIIIKVRPRDKPWMTHEVLTYIRQRNRLYKKFKCTRIPEHHAQWKHVAKEVNYYMHQAKLAHVEKVKTQLININAGSKQYWKMAKQIYGNKKAVGIPDLMVNNKPITTSSDKVSCFNSYFAD